MRRSLSILIALAGLAGCGDGAAPLPSADAARESLRKSLEAWKEGKPASSLASERPPIEVVDFQWKARKTLEDYRIGQDSPGQGSHTVSVDLTIKGEPAPRSAQYMVLGVDPVRIFRDEDFRRAMDMDNAPAPARKKSR